MPIDGYRFRARRPKGDWQEFAEVTRWKLLDDIRADCGKQMTQRVN
jgi:hypothetical protein